MVANLQFKGGIIITQDIFEKNYKYMLKQSDNRNGEVLSNFVFRPKEYLKVDGEYRRKFDIEREGDIVREDLIIEGDEISSKRNIRELLLKNTKACSWKGNVDQFYQVLEYLDNNTEIPEVRGKTEVGLHKIGDEWSILTEEETWNENGVIEEVRYAKDSNVTNIDFEYDSEISKEQLEEIANLLFSFNKPKIAATIVGYLGALFVHWRLYNAYDLNFPILFIHGAAGSGKTQTAKQIINKFCGKNKELEMAGQVSRFTLLKRLSACNTFPIILDEFKEEKLTKNKKDMISELIRGLYNNASGSRGRADQSIKDYNLYAPLILLGEGTIYDEPALVERAIDVFMSKPDSSGHNQRFEKLIKQPLAKFGNDYLNWTLTLSDEQIYQAYDSDTSDRVEANINMVELGLKLIRMYFRSYDINLDIDEYIEKMKVYQDNSLRNEGRISTDVDNILSEIFILYSKYPDAFGHSITYDGDNKVYIWINGAYGELEESRRKKGKNSPLNKREFKKQLRTQNYHEKYNKSKRINERVKKVDILNYQKLLKHDIIEEELPD